MRKALLFIAKTLGVVLAIALVLFLVFRNIQTSFTEQVDEYVYTLPYKTGSGHKVVQGYGGLFSHQHTAALDFAMEEGTPIYAARGGTIFRYKDDSDEGGFLSSNKRKANYIIIQHNDGSFGCYWHLKKNGVLVKKGKVSEGQLIGLSGATGMVVQPHLHFSVKRKLNYDMNSFIRTKFRTTEGVIIPEQNKTYQRP